jgi:CheY-like chemotaxis protein
MNPLNTPHGVTKQVAILIADDDAGHVRLIEKNLTRAGLTNRIHRFEDGQEVLDFLLPPDDRHEPRRNAADSYLLLLDIRMPKVDGIEVLRQLKQDEHLRKLPVIMLTTTDDPREVERCHDLGCNAYMVKPVDYERFAENVRNLGLFLSLVEVPNLGVRP